MPPYAQGITVEQAQLQLPAFERDYRLNPGHAGCAANYASVLFTIGRVAESIPIFAAACEADRTVAGHFTNYAMALKEEGRFEESTIALEQAFQSDPDNFYNKLGYSESLLRAGLWRQAWPLYEEARITKFSVKNEAEIPVQLPELTAKAWKILVESRAAAPLLPDMTRQRIVVYGEGGIGDRICYSRFLPILAGWGFDYTYFCDAGIVNNPGFSCYSLFSRLPWTHAKELGKEPITAVAWTTQFALMTVMDMVPTLIPQYASYFGPSTEHYERYRKLFSEHLSGHKPKLGLIWDAGEKFEGDRKFRSMKREQAARIAACCPGYEWINGNIGVELAHPFTNVRPWDTWDDTAAILANCDGIVSVDTGPMHLAGAMGKPLWIILSGNSDWKYLKKPRAGADKCYWYPQAKFFRNEGIGFEGAIDAIISELNAGNFPGRGIWQPTA